MVVIFSSLSHPSGFLRTRGSLGVHRLWRWPQGSTEHGFHRCARINHHGSFILFSDVSEIDGPLGLRILNGSFACQASPSCGILLHRTLRMRKNPWRSVAPTAHQKPSSRQRSKSNRSVKRPIRAHPLSMLKSKYFDHYF